MHIGASSIIYSPAFFLFFSGILRKHVPLVACHCLSPFYMAAWYGTCSRSSLPPPLLGRDTWGRSGRNSRSHIVQTQRPQQPELFIDEEEEDNRSYPEDEEVITNPDQEKKE